MFKRKPVTRVLDSPRIDALPDLKRVIKHEMDDPYAEKLGIEFAPSPIGLFSTITSLLPSRTRRPRARVVEWQDPTATIDERGRLKGERIRITENPVELGGLTVVHAVASDPNMRVTYTFPTIEHEGDMPDVERMVWGYAEWGSRMGKGPATLPFVEAAPGIGLITLNIAAQADEILVLDQETRDLVAG